LDARAGHDQPGARVVVDHLERAGELASPLELADRTARAAAAAAAQRAYDDAAALYARAARLLEQDPGSAARRCGLLVACGHARRRAGEGETVREAFLEAGRVAAGLGDRETLVPALVRRTIDRVEVGEVDALEAGGEELARLAAELRQPAFTWWTHLWRATSATLRGRLDEGERHARQAHGAGRTAF